VVKKNFRLNLLNRLKGNALYRVHAGLMARAEPGSVITVIFASGYLSFSASIIGVRMNTSPSLPQQNTHILLILLGSRSGSLLLCKNMNSLKGENRKINCAEFLNSSDYCNGSHEGKIIIYTRQMPDINQSLNCSREYSRNYESMVNFR